MTTTVRERPIIFSAPMVRAILAGTKTQTRRAIKPQPDIVYSLLGDRIKAVHTCKTFGVQSNEVFESEIRRMLETNSHITEQRLHGRIRWADLFSHEICWFWSQGSRGLVSARWALDFKGVSLDFYVPRECEGNKKYPQAGLYGFSRDASNTFTPSASPGWQSSKQCSDESGLGNSGRKLAGPESAWDGIGWRKTLGVETYQQRTRAYPVGNLLRPLQSKTCRENPEYVAISDLRYCAFQVGQKLWVREAWRETGSGQRADQTIPKIKVPVIYAADDPTEGPWRSPIHMPRWASRITLEITGVRVERVQDISEADAMAEGVDQNSCFDCRPGYRNRELFEETWHQINGKTFPWSSNPWVWVVEFRKVKP